MAVAAASRDFRPVLQGLPTPRSPTLSDAGMILPDSHARSFSPTLRHERPPSLTFYKHSNLSHGQLSSAPRHRPSHQETYPPLPAQSSQSTLGAMGDSEAADRDVSTREDTLASSPTIQAGLASSPLREWDARDQRRFSTASSSVLSDDIDNWPAFDLHEAFDDSGLGLEEQEKRDQFPGDANGSDDMESERWLSQHSSGSDEDENLYSSAALSRRAEIILANAKKRLNVMEGNLRGARESLVVSPTSNTMRRSPEVSLHINTARERDRRLYAGLGPIPPRTHPHRTSPRSPKIGSPGHVRGQSETSVPLPFSSPSYMTKMATNQRASSAIGHTSGPWSPEGYGQGRFPIKESRSLEVVREPMATTASHDKQYPVRSTSRMNSRSPSALETLQEDEDSPRNNRPTSAAGGLRDQMESLKGRLSSLKVRAQEDQLRRKSMQSLRTPSPFTNAQEWYSGLETRQTEGVPVTANAGLGINCESPTRKHLFAEDEDRPHTSGTTRSQWEGEKLIGQPLTIQTDMDQDNLDGAEDNVFDELVAYDDDGDLGETDERDLASVNGDEPDSVYEDAVYEMPTTERHEDRVDAFDYENFFLHSAMGTYSMENRRSSTASDSSTATTRPVTALQDQEEELSTSEKRISFHARNQSANSISTIATFATAAENQSDDEEENEQMDHFSQQILSQQHVNASRPAASTRTSSIRSDSAINMRHGKGPSPIPTAISRSSATSGDLASGMQVSKIFSILTEASSPSHNEPTLALSEAEKQLIYSLAVSFQQVCANLQHTYGEQYERKAWRRRLDEARQVLNGEEIEDDQSF